MATGITPAGTAPMLALPKPVHPPKQAVSDALTATVMVTPISTTPSPTKERNGPILTVTATAMKHPASKAMLAHPLPVRQPETDLAAAILTATGPRMGTPPGPLPTAPMPIQAMAPSGRTPTETATATTHRAPTATLVRRNQEPPHPIDLAAPTPTGMVIPTQTVPLASTMALMLSPTTPTVGATMTGMATMTVWMMNALCFTAPLCTIERDVPIKTAMAIPTPTAVGPRPMVQTLS